MTPYLDDTLEELRNIKGPEGADKVSLFEKSVKIMMDRVDNKNLDEMKKVLSHVADDVEIPGIVKVALCIKIVDNLLENITKTYVECRKLLDTANRFYIEIEEKVAYFRQQHGMIPLPVDKDFLKSNKTKIDDLFKQADARYTAAVLSGVSKKLKIQEDMI